MSFWFCSTLLLDLHKHLPFSEMQHFIHQASVVSFVIKALIGTLRQKA